jgi:flagellar P-ring protein precursor FlgI
MKITKFLLVLTFAMLIAAAESSAETVRIKDLTNVRGVRSNFLNGIGLVVGLKASGDSKKSLATNKAIATMMTRMGLNISADDIVAGNMAAVMVTAELAPFSRIGDEIDVKVSAVGDAKSLAGGTLILTPLRAGNSEVFAVAQGAVVVGQASGSGPQVLTVARVPQGGTIEREFLPSIGSKGKLTLSLITPDFTTSTRIAESINRKMKSFIAEAKDVGSVEVTIPDIFTDRLVEFLSEIESIYVEPDHKSVVVMNERTGTVVMGGGVVIANVAIAHGDLSIKVDGKKDANKNPGKNVVNVGGTTVGELIESLNALGVKPADLVGIVQSIHAAGALKADLRFL